MRFYMDVIDKKSVLKAAQDAQMNQSTLRAQIRSLEKQAGTEFFVRTGRNIYPNKNGLKFYDFCKEMVEKYEHMASAWDGTGVSADKLTLCASFGFNEYFLPRILHEFYKNNSFVDVCFMTKTSDQIIPDIENKEYDLSIIASSHQIKSPMLATDFGYEVPVVCVCSPQNPLAEKIDVLPDDLKGENVLLTVKGGNFYTYVKHVFRRHKMTFAKEIYLDSQDGSKASVMRNIGIAFMALHVVTKEIENKKLIQLHVKDVEMSRKMFCVHHVERPPSMAAQDFIEETVKVIDQDLLFKKILD